MVPAGSQHPANHCAHYEARPSLAKLFAKARDKATRNERIYEALRAHGYTLQDVGDAVGLHYSTVSRIAKYVATLRDS